jgi:hypothetical protein
MAEITCPSCGELNPTGSEECQFCHTDLTGLPYPSPEPAEQEAAFAKETTLEDPPDLEPEEPGAIESDQPEPDKPVPEGETETPEWLRRIRLRLASDQSAAPSNLGNPAVPEWDQGDESRTEIGAERKGTSSSDFLDWSDPVRQASDTMPVSPDESQFSEPTKPSSPSPDLGEELVAGNFLGVQPPSAFSYNLRISSTQHAHADLLDSIVNSEGLAIPLARRREAAPSPLLRWVIAAILLISVLLPVLFDQDEAPMPFIAEETSQVSNLIEALPEEASILLAFDYDPGFSGEMDAAAAGVIDHLVSRGAYLTLISTIPTGPVLAERFLSETISRRDLVRNIDYVNLGYIPGGAAGLLSLAQDFQRTMPYTLDGELAWIGGREAAGRSEFPPLESIVRLSDFNLVLVLVDDSFTARSWIEQVQPILVDESFETPLAMVVSAQVEPLVRPYYDANPRQVRGFVAGLRGGTAYEQISGRASMPAYAWDAFIFGTSAAGLVLLIGWLAGTALALYDQRGGDQNGGRT